MKTNLKVKHIIEMVEMFEDKICFEPARAAICDVLLFIIMQAIFGERSIFE